MLADVGQERNVFFLNLQFSIALEFQRGGRNFFIVCGSRFFNCGYSNEVILRDFYIFRSFNQWAFRFEEIVLKIW
jgi:hypothetical protein